MQHWLRGLPLTFAAFSLAAPAFAAEWEHDWLAEVSMSVTAPDDIRSDETAATASAYVGFDGALLFDNLTHLGVRVGGLARSGPYAAWPDTGNLTLAAPQAGFGGYGTLGPLATTRFDRAELGLDQLAIYVRNGWGEIVLGRGPGAATLTLAGLDPEQDLTTNPADYATSFTTRGLQASPAALANPYGAAAKLTVQSERILGLQVFASLTPKREGCEGVTHAIGACALLDLAPRVTNLAELGGSFERRVADGTILSIAAFVTGGQSDAAAPIASRDFAASGIGAGLDFGAIRFGALLVRSNQALAGDRGTHAVTAFVERFFGDNRWNIRLSGQKLNDDWLATEVSSLDVKVSHDLSANWSVDVGVGWREQNGFDPARFGGDSAFAPHFSLRWRL